MELTAPSSIAQARWLRSRSLASAGTDGMVRVWDTATGTEIAVLRGHLDCVRAVAFGSDGTLASAGDDATMRLCDVASGQQTGTLTGSHGAVLKLACSSNGMLAGADGDGGVSVWDLARQTCASVLPSATSSRTWR